VLAAALIPILALGDGLGLFWPLLVGTIGLSIVGTIDDRWNLSPWLRVGTEALAGWLLWSEGLGWALFDSDAANLALTVLWVTGVVNAFNLMDNLDGAAASVAAVSAAGVAVLAVVGDYLQIAVIAIGLCGALVGFLRFNLARPARIFLGDGGSMAIGFLIAALLIVVPHGELSEVPSLIAAVIIVGLPVFDTTLVVLSRRRRGAPVLSGATDHTTHRLNRVLRSPRKVSLTLGAAQGGLCVLAIQATRLGDGAALAVACLALLIGAATLIVADGSRWTPASDDS
jgi:UDP-GlcNAc:undecaprenyl-phosphate GlcNAc-1-phosphate transferase